jgi:hypothetical protein
MTDTGQTGQVGRPYQYHFPEDTLPGPGPGILDHWCASSSGNPHNSVLGAAPPTVRRKAGFVWKLSAMSWPLHSHPESLVYDTAIHCLCKS